VTFYAYIETWQPGLDSCSSCCLPHLGSIEKPMGGHFNCVFTAPYDNGNPAEVTLDILFL
jgi:hypothetical protein